MVSTFSLQVQTHNLYCFSLAVRKVTPVTFAILITDVGTCVRESWDMLNSKTCFQQSKLTGGQNEKQSKFTSFRQLQSLRWHLVHEYTNFPIT